MYQHYRAWVAYVGRTVSEILYYLNSKPSLTPDILHEVKQVSKRALAARKRMTCVTDNAKILEGLNEALGVERFTTPIESHLDAMQSGLTAHTNQLAHVKFH